jgi:hypothetical protein
MEEQFKNSSNLLNSSAGLFYRLNKEEAEQDKEAVKLGSHELNLSDDGYRG